MIITIIGLLAGALTTIAFVPQVLKTWRTKSTDDLSLGMYLIFCCGVILWLTYGIIKNDLPIILANGVTLVLALSILLLKMIYNSSED